MLRETSFIRHTKGERRLVENQWPPQTSKANAQLTRLRPSSGFARAGLKRRAKGPTNGASLILDLDTVKTQSSPRSDERSSKCHSREHRVGRKEYRNYVVVQ
ncbi:unnamed protein product [Soboliphyme baturini]|uniref:Uncharacterized protein n=1 Tax=Soboliphyme baturini TaxID=241478 RepID=A0A183IHC7_9BILA|nr:unnamed protein product [Soboliphyme baturini]